MSTTLNLPDVRTKSYSELTRSEARLRIAARVGLNTNPDTKFGKQESNSIYAYITGEFWADPKKFYQTESKRSGNRHEPDSSYTLGKTPPLGTFKRQIVRAVKERLKEEDMYYEKDTEALSYEPGPQSSRGFRVKTLRRLAEYVEAHDDQRPAPSRR